MDYDPAPVLTKDEEKHTVCRVCVRINEGKYYSLFEKYNGLVTPDSSLNHVYIADRISECTNVNITQNDGLPYSICYSCLFELEDAYNFKTKCEKSDKILRSKPFVTESAVLENIPINFEDPVVKEEDDSNYRETAAKDHKNCRHDQYCRSSQKKIHEAFSCINEVDSIKDEIKYEDSLSPACSEPDEKYIDTEPTQVSDNVLKSGAVKPDSEVECNDCGKLFKSKCKLRVHIKREHSTFTCPCCKLVFKSWHAFNRHQKARPKICTNFEVVRVEGEGKSQIFYCKECAYSSNVRQRISSHVLVHTRTQNVKCGLCNQSFIRRNALRFHEERVHNKLSGQKVCHKCGAIVVGFVAYGYHMATHKKHSKIYQCDTCSKTLNSRIGIMAHLQIHTEPQIFSCDICPKSFGTSYRLYSHKKQVHSDTKHTCKTCGRQYKGKTTLKAHEKKHLYLVVCTSCGKFFSRNTELEEHTKKYHGFRPYGCSQCECTYGSKKHLLDHIKRKHHEIKR